MAYCTIWYSDITKAFFTLQCHMCLLYVSKYNFIYDHKKSKNFPMLILTKFKNVEQHLGLISHTEFHTNWTKIIESMDRKLLMPLRKL